MSVFLNVVEDENWYNLCYGGGGVRGSHRSNETRELLRQLNLGKNNPNYGLKRSEETKRKQSEAMTGRPKTYADENGNPLYTYALRYTEFIALNSFMIKKLNNKILELENKLKELKKMKLIEKE